MMHTLLDNFGCSRRSSLALLAAACTLAAILAGCKTQEPSPPPAPVAATAPAAPPILPVVPAPGSSNSLILQPGDNIKVSFPGAPNLDAQTTIRVDGKISLPMIGELPAAGLTPSQLEKDLLRIADPQLVVKEVSVTVVSSSFEIYVSGAVLRPGKLVTDRVITPLEAVMEAGLDYQRANLRNVQVIRKLDNGQTENFKLNLKKPLKGQGSEPFALKQFDIIYVPERFNWF
jgi:polysaccharide export outer membrane protein